MKNNDLFWKEVSEGSREFRSLDRNIDVDVCIVGGGITGVSCAYYLSKEGYKVAVVEKNKICSKTSGKTTGKVTSQHHLFYDYLIKSKGKDFAKLYLKANEKAIDNIENIIKEENIDCNFERKSSFVWTNELKNLQKITDEVKAIQALGFKAKFVDNIEILGKIEGAIEFENQAQFNPVKYVNGLAKRVLENGSEIFENTKVVDYSKETDGFTIITENNMKIKSKYLIIATRYPIFNVPGFHFIKMYQELEYGIAIKSDMKLNGIYVSSEVPIISFRDYQDENGKYILIVGNGHKAGEKTKENGFEVLENFTKKYFPESEIAYKWSAEDAIGLDKIPYIGEYSEVRENMFVATGFKKWGMTSSNIAANLITDMIDKSNYNYGSEIKDFDHSLISGKPNKYTEIFKSTRVEPLENAEEMKNMLKEVGESLIKPRFTTEKGKKYCKHLGGEVSWNEETETWDCPLHGSRYERDGKVIEGPSVHDLD